MSNVVGAVRLERVWEGKLRENFVAITGEFAPKPLEDVVRGLEAHIEKNVPKDKRVHCDVCGGYSSEDLDSCPFCGDQGPPEAGTATPPPAESGVVAVAKDKGTIGHAPEAKADPTEIDATKLEAEGVELEDAAKTKKKSKKAEKEAGKAEAAEKKKVKPPKASPKPSAPAIDIAEAKPVVTEKDLDEQLEAYRDAGSRNATAFWHMGVAISKIHDRLWQQRQLEGKPKYKSWNQFVDAELGISVTYANRLRGVSVNFSEETARKYGPAILMVISRAPKEEHQNLMNKVDQEGLTKRELEKKVQEVREAKGVTVVEDEEEAEKPKGKTKQWREKTEKAAAARKKPTAAITFGAKVETDVVNLVSRPTPQSESYRVKADQVGVGPYAEIKGINGVDLYVAVITDEEGYLQLRYTFRRRPEE